MPWAGPDPSDSPFHSPLGAMPSRSVSLAPPPAPLAGSACVPVSATLAVNDALAARKQTGQQVLPFGFGEAGLPVHPLLTAELASAASRGGYGPVAGSAELRAAAAGYWTRRGLPTSADSVVAGPGSKALLYGLLLAIGSDVAVPRPSWVSYAAQARLTGVRPHFVPAAADGGGICDPAGLARTVRESRAAGRPLRAVIATLPDNPTGTVATPAAVQELCEVAARYDLIIISDEIYRDLVHAASTPFLSPAQVAPDRTIVTTALSKSLALGGWRLGVARLPAGPLGAALRDRLLGVGSEIWSAPAAPVQQAAALAFSEPGPIRERVAQSRALHAAVARGVAGVCAGAGLRVPRAAGLLLRLSRLRAVAGLAAQPGNEQRSGTGPAPDRAVRARYPAGQRLRRERRRAAAADGDRHDLRRHRQRTGGRADRCRPAAHAAHRRRTRPARRDTRRSRPLT